MYAHIKYNYFYFSYAVEVKIRHVEKIKKYILLPRSFLLVTD
jgi:hypothetical protein